MSRFSELSVRARNCLYNHFYWPNKGPDEIDPNLVAQLSEADLMDMPNLGKATVQEIVNWLASYDLKLVEPLSYKEPTVERVIEWLEQRGYTVTKNDMETM